MRSADFNTHLSSLLRLTRGPQRPLDERDLEVQAADRPLWISEAMYVPLRSALRPQVNFTLAYGLSPEAPLRDGRACITRQTFGSGQRHKAVLGLLVFSRAVATIYLFSSASRLPRSPVRSNSFIGVAGWRHERQALC